MKRTLYIFPLSLAFALQANAADKVSDPVVVETQVEVAPAEVVEDSNETRVKKLQTEIQKREAEVIILRKKIEADREQALDNSEGNVNHAKALIDAEKVALMSKLEVAMEKIEKAQEREVKNAEKAFEKNRAFSYEQKMGAVEAFLESSKAALKEVTKAKTLKSAEDSVSEVEKKS